MSTKKDAYKAGRSLPAQSLQVIESDRKAGDYLARLQAKQANPDELAIIVSMLYAATLRGFCSELAKALEVRHA